MATQQNRKGAVLALKAAANSFLTAKAHLNNMAALLDVRLNEDADHELASQAYEMQRIGTGKITLEDLDWFIKKVVD